jgi:UPF0176 protein
MSDSKYQILLFYKYTQIDNPEAEAQKQIEICQKLNLTGRCIVAKEGINFTVEGLKDDTEKYIEILKTDPRFADIHFKKSAGNGTAFPKLSIKVREEIVSGHLGDWDINPNQITGKYLQPEELHAWIKSGKKFYIIDMRNDYEHAVGLFKDSIPAPLKNFRDLPEILPKLESLKDETIVTVCTGGVRCEKASGFLVQHGFKDVYQLYGGIVSYMEKYPNQDFLGKLYVFDGRVTMGFNLEDPSHVVIGTCIFCKSAAEDYYDCANIHCKNKRHFISCQSCINKMTGYCEKCHLQITSQI